MFDRYYCDTPLSGPLATLTGSEAHHLLHVMRAKPGMQVVLFDGRGGEWTAEVQRLGRAEVELALGEHCSVERELACRLTVAVALPKGDRQRWLVEKCVELGVSRLVPLITERATKSAADPAHKLARYVIEASKQCGRNRLMEIAEVATWSSFVEHSPAAWCVVAHPHGSQFPTLTAPDSENRVLAVGPEGGFTDEEISRARETGWQVADLGERILRIETAVLALVATLSL